LRRTMEQELAGWEAWKLEVDEQFRWCERRRDMQIANHVRHIAGGSRSK
jgi:hypothetical protein